MRDAQCFVCLTFLCQWIAVQRRHIGIRRAGRIEQYRGHRAADCRPLHDADQKAHYGQKRI